MQGTKLRGPIVACALLGVVCVSSIAYYFYNRRKKRSLLDRLKQAYTGDHGFFDNDDSLEQEESYDLPEPSEYSDYLIVQATNQDNQLTATSLDKGSKYDDFEEVAYIEDVSDEGRSNKGYKILANKAVSKSRPNAPNHTQEADRSNRSSDNTKKETSDEWTLIDDYTNIDGSAEELVYVESTNNTFSEEVDVQKDKSVPLACEEIVVSSENVDCCNSSCGTDECCHTNPLDNCNSENGLIEEALSTDPVDTKVPEDPIEEVPEQLVDDNEVPEQLVDDNEVPEEPVDTKVPEQLVDDNEVPEELVDDNEVPEEPVEEVPEELVDDNEVPEDESPEQLGDIEVPVEPVDEELPGEILDVDLFVEQVDGELLGEILGTNLLVEQVDVEAPEEIVDNKVPAEPVVIKLAEEAVDEEAVDEEAGEEAEVLSDNSMDQLYDASTPELTKVYFKNFGCSHNISDGEYMLGLLVEYGYKIVDTMEKSHLVIINSCTVKGPSEEAMVTMIKSAVMSYLPVVVSGCVPQADQSNPVFNNPLISLLGITQIDRIVEVVENSLQGNKMVLLEKKDLPRLDLPKIRRNKLIEIIPLSTGCLGSCTFCKTKHSRGVLGSYDIEIILDRVESCVNEGVKEIWLTSEDLGAYGIDIGTNLVTLLRSIVQVLPQGTMLRLGMSNPPFIKKYIDEICEILLHDNVYEFIHIPVQSFSNSVLKKMNREYKVEEFLHLVKTIRTKVPNCMIATDVISGFPTEKPEHHMATRNMLEELKLPVVNISQYYARKGTIACKMKQIPSKVRKGRTRDITNVFMSYETNSKYKGQVIKVYFNQINCHYQLIGHDKHYVKVMHLTDKYFGTVQYVKVVKTTKWHLEGIIV
nr:hypothetical protein MACL_00002557 [Theileria orientalis]